MLFNTPRFAAFFVLVYVLFRLVPPGRRLGVLLGASFVFYTLWYPAYFVLLLASLLLNYGFLHGVAHGGRPKAWLVLSLVSTLGLLGYFKYARMAVETVSPVIVALFGQEPPLPDLFLPLGISFYSFQLLALTIDTYRARVRDRHAEPVPPFRRYLLFVSFFPQLVAGPILRGPDFLPQLERGPLLTAERNRRGVWLVACGLGKKVVLADFLLAPFVYDVFAAPGVGSGTIHLVAMYSFAFQIYFDFSGYVDIARGVACFLGFELPLNFTEPYLSRNPAEFWRRWHMTLSQWLRDYVYIPLGGNRFGSVWTYVSLFLTMLLGGLWHGASWNFVIWGGLHGILLGLHRAVRAPGLDDNRPLGPGDLWRVAAMFHAVALLLVVFRARTMGDALDFLSGLIGGGYDSGWPVLQLSVVVLCAALHPLERLARLNIARLQRVPAATWWGLPAEAVAVGIILGLSFAVSGASGEFIYFQF